MMQTAIFPGRYVQSEGALADLGDEVSRLGTRALVIAGGTAHDSLLPSFLPHWSERLQLTVERFGGECSDQEIERLTQVAKQQACEVVVGMGGGKVIDTAKAVGYQAGARVGIVATIASTDAPVSAVSVNLRHWHRRGQRRRPPSGRRRCLCRRGNNPPRTVSSYARRRLGSDQDGGPGR